MSEIFTPDFLIGCAVGAAVGWCVAEVIRWMRRR